MGVGARELSDVVTSCATTSLRGGDHGDWRETNDRAHCSRRSSIARRRRTSNAEQDSSSNLSLAY